MTVNIATVRHIQADDNLLRIIIYEISLNSSVKYTSTINYVQKCSYWFSLLQICKYWVYFYKSVHAACIVTTLSIMSVLLQLCP